jgi:hypothetical protein
VVVCAIDRWTRVTECERIAVRPSAADIQRTAVEHNDRLLAPYNTPPLRAR